MLLGKASRAMRADATKPVVSEEALVVVELAAARVVCIEVDYLAASTVKAVVDGEAGAFLEVVEPVVRDLLSFEIFLDNSDLDGALPEYENVLVYLPLAEYEVSLFEDELAHQVGYLCY